MHKYKLYGGIQLKVYCLMLFLMFMATDGVGQDFRSVLTAQVTDPSGALIQNVTVTAVNTDSGTSYTAKASSKGVYYIPYVLPGNYTVTAKADGFKTAAQ